MGRSAGKVEARRGGEVKDTAAGTGIRITSRDGAIYQSLERGRLRAKYALSWQIGAGIVGYTYLISVRSYLLQSPASFYVHKNGWDLTPGYESERDLDVDQPVVSGCLFCHTGAIRLLPGSANQYQKDALEAISCKRCHGPEEAHLNNPVAGTIVNPAKLGIRERDSVCEQCHLEGVTRVLNPGKDWWDFRPGQPCEQVFVTYVEDFSSAAGIPAVSEEEELSASRCARESGGRLWCGTCHDPHGEAGSEAGRITTVCLSCHRSLAAGGRHPVEKECVSCHMPRIRPSNVSHAAITDHRIVRKEDWRQAKSAGKESVTLRAWRAAPAEFAVRDEGLAWFDAAAAQPSAQRSESLGRAYDLLRQAAERNPRDPRVLAALGSVLYATGYAGKAAALFEEACRLDPGNPRLAFDDGMALLKTGNQEAAIRALRLSILIDPSFVAAYEKLAETYGNAGMAGERQGVIEEYLTVMPQSLRFRSLLGDE